MSNPKIIERDPLYVVDTSTITQSRKRTGHLVVWGSFILMLSLVLIQFLNINEKINFGFNNWKCIKRYIFKIMILNF